MPAEPDLSSFLRGRSVLVTGGTGSFGRAFARRLLRDYAVKRLCILSRDEYKQYLMAQELKGLNDKAIRFMIGDVRDRDRLEMAMRNIDTVIHAAALKHVPAAEYNPMECINTNVVGAENVVQAAMRAGVDRVIALSTDKAANPVNLYGASKLAADKIFIAANNLSGDPGPVFAVVRYGNVMGSRGSVVPLFRRLVAQGAKALPITDPRMTRFWITLDQGVDFVLSCLTRTRGGEVFVPKIPSLGILDLARAVAPDLPTEIVGIRPGEKLHECMITDADSRTTVDLGDSYAIEPPMPFWNRTSFLQDGARPVAEDFSYSSDTNDQWLDPDTLKAMLDGLDDASP